MASPNLDSSLNDVVSEYLGSIPGFFRFSTWMLGFLIDINHNIEHKKWWKMVPISPLNSRIFEKKKGFKNFAWACGYGDMLGQTFDTFFWILYWISRLLIPTLGLGKTGEAHLRMFESDGISLIFSEFLQSPFHLFFCYFIVYFACYKHI